MILQSIIVVGGIVLMVALICGASIKSSNNYMNSRIVHKDARVDELEQVICSKNQELNNLKEIIKVLFQKEHKINLKLENEDD